MRSKLKIMILVSMLAGCASNPVFDTSQITATATPRNMVQDSEFSLGQTVLWGGTILETRNLQDSTQIEMLAYPLNQSQRPMLEKKPVGRFIVQHQGYLEATVYEQGRHMSVLGEVIEIKTGSVGQSSYKYPVIKAEQLQLWKPVSEGARGTFHFGIGIRL